ncbi:MAG: response regulator [Thermoflexibacter sp.]|jgi:FixJ family two-component response regulator|nr:response regulator [Thermoflexibacter sp.]
MEKPVILCVDDENFVLNSLKAQLRTQFGKDYVIETTESGEDALEVIHHILSSGAPFPIIISDHIMPDMKGDELLIKVHTLSKHTLKIMLTGQADIEAVRNVVNKANLYRYISKPWEQSDLIITVTEALNKYQTDRELEIKNEQLTRYNQELEQKITERTAELRKKNEDLTDSINYAKRIQHAMLPFPERIAQSLGNDYFIIFKPKDIVSGDFYWFQDMSVESYDLGISNKTSNSEKENKIVIVAADCTGHGVPGAFMSMIGNELLNQIVNVHHITSPELILNQLHKGIRYALQQGETENRDGMDIAICVIDKEKSTVEYAGAMNPLYYVQHDSENQTPVFQEIKANKMSIGGLQSEEERIFTKYEIPLGIRTPSTNNQSKTTFYLCSDGFQDQFGGKDNRKFMTKNLKELLLSISHLPMHEQKVILDKTFEDWKGQKLQIDDVLIFGVRV